MSESVAVLVTSKVVPSAMVTSGWTGSTGAMFTSLTVTMKEFVALKEGEPLSVTTTVIVLVLGPWASVGVQVIAPEAGLMDIPEGGESRLKVRLLAGMSESVAEAE